MPVKHEEPTDLDPAWLQRSLDRHYLWGLVFMLVLIVAFPLYRLREPQLRSDALAEQQATYRKAGSTLFAQNCASCHGAGANGGSTAPTLNSKQFLSNTTDEQGLFLISGGVPGSSMVAWSLDFGGALTTEQIRSIVTYLRSLEPNAPSIPDWRRGAVAK